MKKLILSKIYKYTLIAVLVIFSAQSINAAGTFSDGEKSETETKSGGLFKKEQTTKTTTRLKAIVDGTEDDLPGGSGGTDAGDAFVDSPVENGYIAIIAAAIGYVMLIRKRKSQK